MFTDGLDETALNWVRQGVHVKEEDENESAWENISPNVVLEAPSAMYIGLNLSSSSNMNWVLPNSRLEMPMPSGLVGSQIPSRFHANMVDYSDNDDESVSSAPNRGPYEQEEEQEENSYDSQKIQENALLGGFNNLQPDSYVDQGCFRTLPKIGGARVRGTWDIPKAVEATSKLGLFGMQNPRYPLSERDSATRESRVSAGKHSSRTLSIEDVEMYDEWAKDNDAGNPRQETDERIMPEMSTPTAPPILECGSDTQESKNQRPLQSHSIRSEREHGQVEIEPPPEIESFHVSTEASTVHRNDKEEEGVQSTFTGACFQNQPQEFHVSGHNAWRNLIAYDSSIRLCLHAWAEGCMEAPEFLKDECALLRTAFGLQKVLLMPPEEQLKNDADAIYLEECPAPKAKKIMGKVKVEVHKVEVFSGIASRCSYLEPLVKQVKPLETYLSNIKSAITIGWDAAKTEYSRPQLPVQDTNTNHRYSCVPYTTQYIQHISSCLRVALKAFHDHAIVQRSEEKFSCMLQLTSSLEEQYVALKPELSVWMQPGSSDAHTFFPESHGDVLVLEVQDSRANVCGRVQIKISSINDDMNDKLRWWPLFREPEHQLSGKAQISLTFVSASIETTPTKCGPVGGTLAYDLVLKAAMRMQRFQSRNLHLHGPWKWLLKEFAGYYGVSESYTRLRYLACIMDVATPTKDCFDIVYEFLVPIMNARDANALNRQEKLMLAEIEVQLEHLLATAFENYKSLDEASLSGLVDSFGLPTGEPAPALMPAVQVYSLLHDILSNEAQTTLRNYLQTAARKRCKRHLTDTDEFMTTNNDGCLMDAAASNAYSKMKLVCLNIRSEIQADIQIHNQHILPSCIDLPNITAAVYGLELCSRLQRFLVACPPSGPSRTVIELLITTADFQRDLLSWNIRPIQSGVNAKELFDLYIMLWMQDKRLYLLELCKLDKVHAIEAITQNSTSQFIEEMYERIRDTLNEYEVIVNRWPEYSIHLEIVITSVERAAFKALEKLFSDVLSPLRESLTPKKSAIQYMQRLARSAISPYCIPNQLGLFLNTVKRILDVLHPRVEAQLRSWASCLLVSPNGDKKTTFGEQLDGVTLMLRTKYKAFLQAVVEKIMDNTEIQRTTKLKRILKDTKEAGGEAEIRDRMQPLNAQLLETITQLHDIFSSKVFVAITRAFWDKMGQEVLSFVENRKENKYWYKGSSYALDILDDAFASQMQRLQGNAVNDNDLEPPTSVQEARSMLSRDTPADSSKFYFL